MHISDFDLNSYRSLTGLITAIRGLKHLLSSLFASTFASRAVSSTDNKLQQSDNLDFKTLPFLTIQLVPIPRPPTAHKALDTSVFAQKGSPQTLHSSIPPRLLLPGIFSSSPPPCWLAGWLRVGGPPSSGGHGSGLAVGVDVVVGQQVKIFGWATNLVDMLLVVML